MSKKKEFPLEKVLGYFDDCDIDTQVEAFGKIKQRVADNVAAEKEKLQKRASELETTLGTVNGTTD